MKLMEVDRASKRKWFSSIVVEILRPPGPCKDWQERSQSRAEEMHAIQETLSLLGDDEVVDNRKEESWIWRININCLVMRL